MPKIIFLGVSNAIPSLDHDSTHMVLVGEQKTVLIDCGTNPVVSLHQAGLNPLNITDLIITHFHPDHVGGLPMFLMDSWLLGRQEALNIYGLASTIEKARQMMALFEWHMWPGFYKVNFVIVPPGGRVPVLQTSEFRILASPVEHLIPNIGLRMEFPDSGKVLAYSCDTMPSPAVIDLAERADWLIHEATGDMLGHTSAEQAGEIAGQAGVKKLYLIHYQTWDFDASGLVHEAQRQFAGTVELARDYAQIEI